MDSRQIVLTFDVENDCGLKSSFKGIELGLPKIVRILKKFEVPATFFVTGEIAELYPAIVRNLGEQFEVGCHGYYHESFQKIDSHKKNTIKSAKKLLEETIGQEVLGFRAPFLRVSHELFDTLIKTGFKYDSSLAWFKVSHWRLNVKIREFRLMFPNIFFRFPLGNSLFKIGNLLNKLPVFYFHPWEGIDVRSLFLNRPHFFWNLFSRPDRWFNTGSTFLNFLSKFISYYKRQNFRFETLQNLV